MKFQENIKYMVWIIVAIILSIAIVSATVICSFTALKVTPSRNVITVTGSSKKDIISDYTVWSFQFSTRSTDAVAAYDKLNDDTNIVEKYLKSKGISAKEIEFTTITPDKSYMRDSKGNVTNAVDEYIYTQNALVKSTDVTRVTEVSKKATELIKKNVDFISYPPQYYYTKLADLKIDMLGSATKDTQNRARKIADSTGTQIGKLKSAKMGVFQITAPNSNEISDYGTNDTSSIKKEITAVMTCEFEIN